MTSAHSKILIFTHWLIPFGIARFCFQRTVIGLAQMCGVEL
jgi:hypothetical protein